MQSCLMAILYFLWMSCVFFILNHRRKSGQWKKIKERKEKRVKEKKKKKNGVHILSWPKTSPWQLNTHRHFNRHVGFIIHFWRQTKWWKVAMCPDNSIWTIRKPGHFFQWHRPLPAFLKTAFIQDAWWMPDFCGIISNVIYLWTCNPALQEACAREEDEKQPLKAWILQMGRLSPGKSSPLVSISKQRETVKRDRPCLH